MLNKVLNWFKKTFVGSNRKNKKRFNADNPFLIL